MITAIFENNQLVSYSLKTWQYDYGQTLRIEGLNLPTAVEIHFSLTEKGGEAVTRVGMTKDGVTDVVIPDSFLENNDIAQDYQIYAFIYLRDDTSGQTEYKIPISVTSRPKPEAFNRPEDGEIFKEAIQAVRESADQAAESARQAELIKDSVQDMVDTIGSIDEQVQAVKGYAQKAETASSNAELSESRAKESETAAETAKTAAVQSAESAKQSEAAVETARQEVAENKTAVEQAVSGFDEKVAQSSTAIESAKTGAVKAVKDKGDEVLQSIPPDFETQMANKVDKQQGIENKGKALVVGDDGNVVPGELQSGGGDGIAIINTMSGESPLVIPDSAERVNKGFSLIGKSEQVTTTGANLFNYKDFVDINTYADEGFIYRRKYLQLKPNTPYRMTIFNNRMSPSGDGVVMFIGDKEKYDNTNANGAIVFFTSADKKSVTITTEESGQIVFKLNKNSTPELQEEYLSQADIILSEGSTEIPHEPYTGRKPSPSPDYPQEIKSVGKWNEEKQKYEVDVKVTGKNLFDKGKVEGTLPIVNYRYLPIYVKKGAKVSVSCKKLSSGLGFYALLSKEKGVVNSPYSWLYHNSSTNLIVDKVTFTAESDIIYFNFDGNKQNLITELANFLQIEISDAPTSYQPYKEQTLTLTSDRPLTKWDRLEKRDGVWGWVYQHATCVMNGSEPYGSYGISDENRCFTFSVKDSAIGFQTSLIDSYINRDVVWDEKNNGIFCIYSDHPSFEWRYFRPPNETVKTIEQWKEWLSKNNLTMIYKTKESEFVSLSDAEQKALNALHTYYPTTVVTADGGEVDPNIEVTYVADTKNYIEQKIESINKAIVTTQKALL